MGTAKDFNKTLITQLAASKKDSESLSRLHYFMSVLRPAGLFIFIGDFLLLLSQPVQTRSCRGPFVHFISVSENTSAQQTGVFIE